MRYRIFIAGEIALTAQIEPNLMPYTIRQTIKRLEALSERGRILVTVDDENGICHIIASRKASCTLPCLTA